ncbi:hypothetical protein LP52_17490 [Streptomonospora alba]|uniref:N-acetyltransferase domain-containing protein n=1 Tax=Streptomonospora alba TaxID=183763 RepID=A0A0C2JG07_9ACTN|nr:GNAT family N-acetyltransferase [Streptomonospora alba]KIH97830.1 hypothetical protein LP52_17490 [Streptomonospora alba]
MNEGIEIRPRVDGDVDACARLLVEVHERDGYPVEGVADPHGWLVLGDTGRAWVAVVEGNVAGHVGLGPAGDGGAVELWKARYGSEERPFASIGRLFVAPAARGRGVARALLERAVSAGRRQGRQLVLEVMEKDRAAIRLYEHLGWECIGRLDHVVGAGARVPALAYALPG